MHLDPQRIGAREKLILAGLFLAKFDALGLKSLGFESFTEAFNVMGFGLGAKPASIKNYRDEFDPLFPNPRKGWHKRRTRQYCLEVFEKYRGLELAAFTGLLKGMVGYDEKLPSIQSTGEDRVDGETLFAQRMVTGLAAEHYFETVQPGLPEFKDFDLTNTTRLGCGYDFRLTKGIGDEFLAVEVKGLNERKGNLSLTSKEYETAATLNERFYLFVVVNFQESPYHTVYRNPLASGLRFARKERVVVQVAWSTSV